jgi:hypothetical protein
MSIHDSSDSTVVVLVQVKQVATVNQHPHQCTMKDEMVSRHETVFCWVSVS